MSVAMIAIGDEVLRAETRERNGALVAEQLAIRGVPLQELRVVADRAEAVISAVRSLTDSVKLIITTGGLGPTDDDGTRQAMATLAGAPLQQNATLADAIRGRYERMGREWIALNLRQAAIPAGSTPLLNSHGTAPGFVVQCGAVAVASLPGPPREVAGMLTDHLDALLQHAGLVSTAVEERCLRLFGITESGLQDRLRHLDGYDDVLVRSLPSFPEIRLEIRARPGRPVEVARRFETIARETLGWRVFASDRDTKHAAVVAEALMERGLTVAVAESCTGGLVGHLLTEVPGVSATFQGSFVTYANAAKRDVLGVPAALLETHGAVSEAVVTAMAEAAKRLTGADYAVATSGIAGPTGGTEHKPVGTVWLAVAGPSHTRAHHRVFPGLQRARFKRLAAWSALALIRRAVLQIEDD